MGPLFVDVAISHRLDRLTPPPSLNEVCRSDKGARQGG